MDVDTKLPIIGVEIKSVTKEDVSAALVEIIEHRGHDPRLITTRNLGKIAETLSRLVDQNPPWQWRYLRNIINCNYPQPPVRIIKAIYALRAIDKGTSPLIACAQVVQVRAVGNVSPGAVVLADSRTCDRIACPVEFVPRSGNQRFCCPQCRQRAAKEKP